MLRVGELPHSRAVPGLHRLAEGGGVPPVAEVAQAPPHARGVDGLHVHRVAAAQRLQAVATLKRAPLVHEPEGRVVAEDGGGLDAGPQGAHGVCVVHGEDTLGGE